MPELIPEPRYARFARDAGECLLDDPLLDVGPGTEGTARWLRRELGGATGWELPAPAPGEAYGGRAVIRLVLRPELARSVGAESYELHVAQRGCCSKALTRRASSTPRRRCASCSAPRPTATPRPRRAAAGGCRSEASRTAPASAGAA